MQNKKTVLVVLSEFSPSAIINVTIPLSSMAESGQINLVSKLQNEVTSRDLLGADILVLCRNWTPIYRPIFELALELKIPIIYDLDDHVLGAPKGSYTDQLFKSPGRREMLEWLLQQASLVRAHSPVLEQVVRQYNVNTSLVSAPINWSLVPETLPTLSSGTVHIVYAANKETGEHLYRYIQQDLHAVLERYGTRVHLHFLGYRPPDLCQHPIVTCHSFEANYAAFFSKFTRFGYAIGLAPMVNDLFHNSKTNLKFRDYAAAGAAGIYADTPLFRGNGVIERETGLLVPGSPGSWLPALAELIENPLLVEKIRRNARKLAEERYSLSVVTDKWLETFDALPSRPTLSEEQQRVISLTEWPFTVRRKPDSPWIGKLRSVLRAKLPVRYRVFYYDTKHRILTLRSRFKKWNQR